MNNYLIMISSSISSSSKKITNGFAEESWTLPGQLIREVMEDETCMALPKLKEMNNGSHHHHHHQITNPKQFYVSMKSLDTQKEYMHPQPFNTLQGYNIYFLNCYLLEEYDTLVSQALFPTLKEPGSNGVGPVSVEEFQLRNGARFQIIAVVAPEVEQGNICVHVNSPLMPVSVEAFNTMHPRGRQKGTCMLNFGVLGLLENAYDDGGTSTSSLIEIETEAGTNAYVHGGPATNVNTEDDVLVALLTHGASAVAPMGGKRARLTGMAKMFEIERTAGSISLPLVLRHLHWLQFSLDDDANVPYRIMAPNKFAYAVHMPNVCGWEIYYSVNMKATYHELVNLFTQTRMRLPLQSNNLMGITTTTSNNQMTKPKAWQVGNKATERHIGFFMEKLEASIAACKPGLGPMPIDSPETWPEQDFFKRMQIVGLQNIKKNLVNRTQVLSEYMAIEKAKPLLQFLSSFYERFGSRTHQSQIVNTTTPFSVEDILLLAHKACMGCAIALWDRLPGGHPMDSKRRANEFITLIKTDLKDCGFSIDYEMLPILFKCCMNRPVLQWWEVGQEHIRAQNVPSSVQISGSVLNIACICTTFLYHSKRLSSYFPQVLFPEYANGSWKRLVDEACDAKPDLHKARELFKVLQTIDNKRYKDSMPFRRKLEYCAAVGFAMLMGINSDGETVFDLKAM